MSQFYKGKYKPINKAKYINPKNLNNIVYRSSWELMLMKWLDKNSQVASWGSEEIILPYISKVDGRQHRYFLDFYIKFTNGKVYLVEVKPKHQTIAPVAKKGKTKERLLKEATTYATNISKWEAARNYATKKGAEFHIWTEDHLSELGLKMQVSKKFRYVKYANKKQKGAKNGKTK